MNSSVSCFPSLKSVVCVPLASAVLPILIVLLMGNASAQATANATNDAHGSKEVREDIARHRAMSAAHEAAAKCLESGKKEDVCVKGLTAACKGLAIGKYCGMKHVH